jgi:hypothetical protein
MGYSMELSKARQAAQDSKFVPASNVKTAAAVSWQGRAAIEFCMDGLIPRDDGTKIF